MADIARRETMTGGLAASLLATSIPNVVRAELDPKLGKTCDYLEKKLEASEKLDYLAPYVPIIEKSIKTYVERVPNIPKDFQDPTLYLAVIAWELNKDPKRDDSYKFDPMKITKSRSKTALNQLRSGLQNNSEFTSKEERDTYIALNRTKMKINDQNLAFLQSSNPKAYRELTLDYTEANVDIEISIHGGIATILGNACIIKNRENAKKIGKQKTYTIQKGDDIWTIMKEQKTILRALSGNREVINPSKETDFAWGFPKPGTKIRFYEYDLSSVRVIFKDVRTALRDYHPYGSDFANDVLRMQRSLRKL